MEQRRETHESVKDIVKWNYDYLLHLFIIVAYIETFENAVTSAINCNYFNLRQITPFGIAMIMIVCIKHCFLMETIVILAMTAVQISLHYANYQIDW